MPHPTATRKSTISGHTARLLVRVGQLQAHSRACRWFEGIGGGIGVLGGFGLIGMLGEQFNAWQCIGSAAMLIVGGIIIASAERVSRRADAEIRQACELMGVATDPAYWPRGPMPIAPVSESDSPRLDI